MKNKSRGRPKENKILRELKVKTWFNAVAEASGKTAYQLEKEFSPSYVDVEKFNRQRSRLWEKYRLGKTLPTIKELKGGRRPVALMVEEKYPGTLNWLTNPIWVLADPDANIGMEYLKLIYGGLAPDIKSLLLTENASALFWRKPHESFEELVSKIVGMQSIDGFITMLCLLRESMICQQQHRFNIVRECFKVLSISQNQPFVPTKNIAKFIYQNFSK